jgi:hypothetical protein
VCVAAGRMGAFAVTVYIFFLVGEDGINQNNIVFESNLCGGGKNIQK